jgi:hypothetical protein
LDEVAITGMKDIGDPKVILLADFGDAPRISGSLLRSGNAVLNVVVGCQSTHGASPFCPSIGAALIVVLGDSNYSGAVAGSCATDSRVLGLLADTFDFDEKHSLGILGKPPVRRARPLRW